MKHFRRYGANGIPFGKGHGDDRAHEMEVMEFDCDGGKARIGGDRDGDGQ